MGGSAEGADRGAARGGREPLARSRAYRPPRRRRDRDHRLGGRGAARCACDERREARRDRTHGQVGLGAMGVRRALARRGSGRRSCWSPATSSDRWAACRAATRSCSSPRPCGRRPSRSAQSRPARPRRSSRSGAGPTASCGSSPTSSSGGGAATSPSSTATRTGRSSSKGFDPRLERVHESLLTLADGRIGTRGAPLASTRIDRARGRPLGCLRRRGSRGPARCVPGLDAHRVPAAKAPPRHAPARPARGAAPRGGPGNRAPLLVACASGHRRAAGPVRRPQFLRRSGRRRVAQGRNRAAAGPAARSRLRAPRRVRRGGEGRSGGARRCRGGGLRAPARRAPRSVGAALGGRRRRHRGRRRAAARVRFALFHLMASVGDRGEAAVGARGLSGPAYRGHVFWDSDVFVLPFLAATHPAAARAMLEYRVRRLPAAREAARELGRQGARFPWESAASGVDVTPRPHGLPRGELVPDPHRRARGAHRRRRRLGRGAATSTGPATTRSPPAPGASSSSRPRATGRRVSASSATAARTSTA